MGGQSHSVNINNIDSSRLGEGPSALSKYILSLFTRWFLLRLLMGYSLIAILLGVAVLCGAVILHAGSYSEAMVERAAATLLVDLVALSIGVFKVVLPYNSAAQLKPVTKIRPS